MITRWIKKLSTKDRVEETPSPVNNTPKKAKKKNNTKGKARSHHQKGKTQKAKWDISQFQVEPQKGKTRFHDLDLPEELMHAIYDLGFEYCSPIQSQVLPHTLQGLDAIGKAQTGTGKTAAFLITIIDDLLNNPLEHERYLGEPRALIVAPTRELVDQIAKDATGLCKHSELHVATLIGGNDYAKQKQNMNKKPVDIVVATPGRLIDFMTRKDIYLDRVESLVLDEADRMLDMGFIPQVKRIVRATPRNQYRQTLLFSATFSQDIMNLAKQWTEDPVTIEIEPENVATDTVDQQVFMVSHSDKLKVLFNILRSDEVGQVIVFANRRDQTLRLYEKIRAANFSVGILSGEINQAKRTRTLAAFKDSKIKILVATDVVGRGIHIDGISHVINYNLSDDPEDYVHRIGRTGRAGTSGTAITLACEDEAFQLPAIEELLGKKLTCTMVPESLLN